MVGEFDRRPAWINKEVYSPCWLTRAYRGAVGVEGLEHALVRRQDISVGSWKVVDLRSRFRRIGHLGGQRAKMGEDVAHASPT
jgi:hypothetical protein